MTRKETYDEKRCIIFALLFLLGSVSLAFADTDTNLPMRIGERKELGVPLYQQVGEHNCGPACIRMTLKKFGITKTEDEIACRSCTDTTGTYVYRVVDTLNYYLGSGYAYYGTWEYDFSAKMVDSIKAGYPVICHVAPGVLPNYENQHVPDGHYVVVKGYVIQAVTTTYIMVLYNDPNNNPATYGSYSTSVEIMEQAIDNNAGYFIAH